MQEIAPLPYGFGPWQEPVCAAVFGPAGSGKSTDLVSALPDAWVFAMPGGVRSSSTFVGPDLYSGVRKRTIYVRSLHEVTAYLALMVQGKMERRPIIIDDASLLAGTLHDLLQPQFPKSHTFQFWGAIKAHVRQLRDAGRWAGVHVFLNAHPIEGAPKWELDEKSGERKYVKAGPLLAGKSITPEIVFAFDMVLEVRRDEERVRQGLFPSVYWSEPNSATSHVKDRHGVVHGVTPMNLREILRAAGFIMPRPRGLEWMDELTPVVSRRLDKGETRATVFGELRDKLIPQVGKHLGGWALRDAFDAYDIANRESWLDRAYIEQAPPPTSASLNPLLAASPSVLTPGALPAASTVSAAAPADAVPSLIPISIPEAPGKAPGGPS